MWFKALRVKEFDTIIFITKFASSFSEESTLRISQVDGKPLANVFQLVHERR